MSGYAAVAHFADYPIFGVMYYGIVFDISLFYVIPYEKAFKVPGLLSHAKSVLQVEASSVLSKAEARVVRRQVRSIQPEGIKVGEFHTQERTSTPAFLHYVLCNVVNMLVGFG